MQIIEKQYEIRDLGEVSYFLGVGIKRNLNGISFSQERYIRDIIQRFGIEECRPAYTPLESEIQLSKEDLPKDA